MIRDIFTKNKNKRTTIPSVDAKNDVPEGIMTKCPQCKNMIVTKDLMKTKKVCPKCDHHFKMTASERVDCLFDEGTFESNRQSFENGKSIKFPSVHRKS